jgi:hypothetical protein
VHDFIRVDLPFDAVVGAFTHFVTSDLVCHLVADAWADQSAELDDVLPDLAEDRQLTRVVVSFGDRRARRGALILPIAWDTMSGQWIPPLEADLEIVSFGPERTHLHVLGQSQLRPRTPLFTERASLEHRLAVAVVRQFLRLLAEVVSTNASPSRAAGLRHTI